MKCDEPLDFLMETMGDDDSMTLDDAIDLVLGWNGQALG